MMVSTANEAAGPHSSVTGVMIRPGSGIRVSKPSWMPTGAAMYVVANGLPRWATWWAIHHRAQT